MQTKIPGHSSASFSTFPLVEISTVLQKVSMAVDVDPDQVYQEIGVRSHGKGIFHKEPITGATLGEKRVFYVQPKCLVFNIVFAWEQGVAVTSEREIGLIASHRFPMYQAINQTVDLQYLYYYFTSPRGKLHLELASPGGAGRNRTLGQNEFLHSTVPLPPLPEQKKIAAILSTWDRAIELTEKLIAAKQKRKAVLMQQLLTGKVRLPRFSDPWKKCQLGDVANNSTRRNESATTSLQVYSVTNSVGMVPMSVDVIGESIERYKTVARHDFAYNPMRINVGSIAMWDGDTEVLVSPDYVVFQCGSELDAEFLNHFRETHYWHQFVNRSGGGSVRVRIYFSELAELALKLPPLEEQNAIAAVLKTADREIDLHQHKLNALRRQKKGLMQQLLTGKVRVSEAVR